MRTVVLLPTYNERENVQTIVPEIVAVAPEVDIMVIDDNSPDGTAGAVQTLMGTYPNLRLYQREKKEGLGKAYLDTFQKILGEERYDVIITMDADGSHDPVYLRDFLHAIQTADVVVGSRYIEHGGIENWEMWRRNLSKYGNLYARLLTGLPIHDLTAGFYCIKTPVLARLPFSEIGSSGYAFQIDLKFNLVHHGRASVKEVPIVFKSRREGESKMSRHIITEGLLTPLRLFFKRF